MVVVFTRFSIKPEYHNEYAKYLKEVVKSHNILQQPGIKEMKLLCPKNIQNLSQSNIFTIVTGWNDMKSFTNYTKSDSFKKSHENMPPREWFAGKPEIEVYEVL